nr:hypothetical protein [uncultured bacterium]
MRGIKHFTLVEHVITGSGFGNTRFTFFRAGNIKCHGWELVLDGLYCSSVLICSACSGVSFLLASNALVE